MSKIMTCDRATELEELFGTTTGPLKVHIWSKPVKLGDRCQCGERVADEVLVEVKKDE